jgi:hypothetical protein
MLYKTIKKNLLKFYPSAEKANQNRFSTLIYIIYGLIKEGNSHLDSLGSVFPDDTDLASRSAKVKRFLKSKYTDCELLFFPFVKQIIAGLSSKQELVLAIDGTDLGKSCGALLVSLVLGKRSLPLIWLVKEGNKGHFSSQEHVEVLQQVASLLPPSISVTVLGDGEFDSIDLQEFIESTEWKYALRTAKNTYIEDSKGDSYKIGELVPFDGMDFIWLENCSFTKKKWGSVFCLVWHSPEYKDPIYLVSNIEWAKDIMDYYKKRWSIETLFADIKSRGFNIHKTRIKDPEMLHNLLIMIAIAFYLCMIIGVAKDEIVERLPKIFRKDRMNELSNFQIGRRIIAYYEDRNLKINKLFKKALAKYFCVRF